MTENYSELVSSFKIFAEIQQKLTASDGRNFAVTDENIDEANELIGKGFSAISNIEKVLQLQKKSPSVKSPWSTDPQVHATDENQMIENALSAMSHLKKAFKIKQKSPSFDGQEMNYNDDDEAFSQNDFSAAMTSCREALESQRKYSPPNVSLSTNYNNIGQTYYLMGDYTIALSLFEKALENLQKCSPINQQLLAKTYDNIALALEGLDRYREALDYVKQAFDTARSVLGSNHPATEAYRNHSDQLQQKL
jgi:tetratricopeptide (TPR) repeat protein